MLSMVLLRDVCVVYYILIDINEADKIIRDRTHGLFKTSFLSSWSQIIAKNLLSRTKFPSTTIFSMDLTVLWKLSAPQL